MSTLIAWWGFIWGVYLQALSLGSDVGGLWGLLIYLLATVAAFGLAVVAPALLVVKLVVIVFTLSIKVALFAFAVWITLHASQSIGNHFHQETSTVGNPSKIFALPHGSMALYSARAASCCPFPCTLNQRGA